MFQLKHVSIMKTAIINARVKPQLKNEVESILSQLGITTTQAITMYFLQIKMTKGIPFSLKIPNDKTIEAMKEARANENMQSVTLKQLEENFTQ